MSLLSVNSMSTILSVGSSVVGSSPSVSPASFSAVSSPAAPIPLGNEQEILSK